MKRLVEFTLPIKGLKIGVHEYDFHIGRSFFSEFEASPVADGDVDVHVTLDRRSDMLVFDFDIEGTVKTECDRCLAEIDLPIEGSEQLIFKFSEQASEPDDDLVFIHPETSELNLSNYVYEFVVLSIPMVRTIEDCEDEPDAPCDFSMLERIAGARGEGVGNPFRDALGDFQEN